MFRDAEFAISSENLGNRTPNEKVIEVDEASAASRQPNPDTKPYLSTPTIIPLIETKH
jgi:hypothetical protein